MSSDDDLEEDAAAEEYDFGQEMAAEDWAEAMAIQDDAHFCTRVCDLIKFAHDSGDSVAKYPEHERVVTYVYIANIAISNGGFGFLFSADMPDDTGYKLTRQSLEAIECHQAVKAFDTAAARFAGGNPPADLGQRQAALRTIDEFAFEAENDLYFESGVLEKLAAYIRRHEQAIKESIGTKRYDRL